jgi:hypothetical protein
MALSTHFDTDYNKNVKLELWEAHKMQSNTIERETWKACEAPGCLISKLREIKIMHGC